MKTIKINSVLSNSDDETTNVEALAEYNEEENTIRYKEEELKVELKISSDKVSIKRTNDDYNLNLEFKENESTKCKYIVKSVGLELDVEVLTKILEIKENRIYINYELFNEGKLIGAFEYKLIFRE